MGRTLATLFHLSDLHIGDVDWHAAVRGDERLDPVYRDWWRRWSIFDGYFGHEHLALTALVDKWVDLEIENEKPLAVFTGDLTASGGPQQFLMGGTFLGRQVILDRNNPLGLNQLQALARSIPGNHDGWPGSARVLGPRSLALESLFGACPRIQRVALGGDRTLVFVLVDSEWNVDVWGLNRLAARGEFYEQLDRAGPLLTGDPRKQIRVLALHHTRLTNARFTERISPRSAQALEQFIADHDIAVLLTGHIHEPRAGAFPVAGQHRYSLEFCAGTTSQRPEPPGRWRLAADRHAKRSRLNSLLVHRIEEDDHRALHWKTQLFVRVDDGFVPADVRASA